MIYSVKPYFAHARSKDHSTQKAWKETVVLHSGSALYVDMTCVAITLACMRRHHLRSHACMCMHKYMHDRTVLFFSNYTVCIYSKIDREWQVTKQHLIPHHGWLEWAGWIHAWNTQSDLAGFPARPILSQSIMGRTVISVRLHSSAAGVPLPLLDHGRCVANRKPQIYYYTQN
jgi:hypothetical protein